MTRINLIPPSELIDKHLVAEYRELPRIFSLAKVCNDAPKSYKLGTGHVKFFYDKLKFLANRHELLIQEMNRRGFKTNFKPYTISSFNDKVALWNDWSPDSEEIAISRERIEQKKEYILNKQNKKREE